MNPGPFLLVLCLIVAAIGQSVPSTAIQVNSVYNISLLANEHHNYTFKIGSQQPNTTNLFITAETPFNDPFEQPYIRIMSDNNFLALCDDQASSYTGICEINNKQLTSNRQFTIQIYCLVDCKIGLAVYLSDIYALDLGKTIQLSSMSNYGLAKYMKLTVPQNLEFSAILIVVQLINYQTAMEGLTLLVNYGPNATMPVVSEYAAKGKPTYGHRLSVEVSNKQVSPGEQVAIYIFLGINNTIELTTTVVSEGMKYLSIGQPIVDFITNSETNKYMIDMQKYSRYDIDKEDIQIKFIIYNGVPDIQIFFNENLTNSVAIDNWGIQSSLAFLLTPQFRNQNGFNGELYIAVVGYGSSSYYLEVEVNNKLFISMENQIMEMVKLETKQMQNFIYEDETSVEEVPVGGLVRYKLKVEMKEGAVQLGLRICQSSSQINECMLSQIAQLDNPNIKDSFNSIEGNLSKYYNTYILLFDYNVTTCQLANSDTHLQRYLCDFHMFLYNPSSNTEVYLGIQISKQNQNKQLKQGVLVRQSVSNNGNNFYRFYLHDPTNIKSIQIYATVIQGDVGMLLSRKIRFPEIDSFIQNQYGESNDIVMSTNGRLNINQEDITAGDYYVGVFGYELSDYLISVAIERFTNNTNSTDVDVTEIQLQKGTSVSYTMGKGKKNTKFTFTPSVSNQKSLIKVESIVGEVYFTVTEKDSANQVPLCTSYTIQEKQSDYCELVTKGSTTYLIIVSSFDEDLGQEKQFIVSYSDENICQEYPIDYPLYLRLSTIEEDGDFECFRYAVYEYKDIEITLAMSEIDQVRANDVLNVSINFGNEDHLITFTSYEYIIKQSQLKQFCQQSNSTNKDVANKDKSSKCEFNVKVVVNSQKISNDYDDYYIELMLAVQAFDDENVLFEGIQQKIATQKISTTHAKYFYYYLYDPYQSGTAKIYLNSQTKSSYQIACRVVDESDYYKDKQNSLYPKYNKYGNGIYAVNSSEYSPITLLTINSDNLALNTTEEDASTILLIAVYGISTDASNSYIFSIQITQSQSTLEFGESKIGYVNQNQIYEYYIEMSSSNVGILTVRSLGEQECIDTYIETKQYVKENEKDGFESIEVQFNQYKVFNKERGYRNIIVRGKGKEVCTYQISYNSVDTPLKYVIKSVPYSVYIENGNEINYFLYYHTSNASFYVVLMVNSGNGIMYTQPLSNYSSTTLEKTIEQNVEKFAYAGEQNTNVFIDKNSKEYCTQCYYVIAVKGKAVLDGELILTEQNIPIPLKEGSIIKNKIQDNNKFINIYQFYSVTDFKLILNPIYGRINVAVMTPDGHSISEENIGISTEIAVPAPANNQNKNIDYFDETSRYIINITSNKNISYSIGVKKQSGYVKLYQGTPMRVEVNPNAATKVQFTNIESNVSLNLLVEDLNYDLNKDNNIKISANLPKMNGKDVIKNVLKSEGSYNVDLLYTSDDYYLNIDTQLKTNLSIILAKVAFTHLVAGRSLVLTYPSIFQVFSPGDSIMIEIFSCKNDIVVSAGNNYTKIANNESDGVLTMEHANYGGHYVISADNVNGEYFVQTKPLVLSQTNMNYVMSYYLYSSALGEQMPYRIYDISSPNIQYSYSQQAVQYKLPKIYRKDNIKSMATTTYYLYIANSSQAIQRRVKCSLGELYSVSNKYVNTKIELQNNNEYVVFDIKMEEIKKAVGDANTYYIGGEAEVAWSNSKQHHVKGAYFSYGILQQVANNEPSFSNPVNKNTGFVVLWIIVPFLLGSIVMYFALRYFIRSVRYQPTQLVEEDDVLGSASNQPVVKERDESSNKYNVQPY